MKKTLLLLLALSALAFLHQPPISASGLQSKEFRQTIDLESGGSLSLNTDKGSVRVTAWDQNKVEIYARIEAPERVSQDYGRRAVEAARVDVTGNARSLAIRSNFDDVPSQNFVNFSKSLPNIHYEIRAPRQVNLTLDADRCRVEVEGLAGRIKINTDRTPVKASDLNGEIYLRMDRGDARLARIEGSLDIETDRTDGRLQTVLLRRDSRLDIGRGDFEVGLSASQGLNLSANLGRRENLQTDFGITTKNLDGNRIEGTINGGGPRLTIHTDRSSVRLKRE